MIRRRIPILASAFCLVLPVAARAQDVGLHFTQAGAQLARAEAELRILYAAVTAKEFDPALTQATMKELDAALGAAKRATDRSTALLSEAQRKLEPEMIKLREAIKAAEDQLRTLGTDIDEQTDAKANEEEEDTETGPVDEIERAASGTKKDKADWELLKTTTGWLGVDVEAARAKHRDLSQKLKLKPYPLPAKPKGRRPGR